MIVAYRHVSGRLERIDPASGPQAAVRDALWVDLCAPTPDEAAAAAALGFDVPSLEDMEEIELSNRLYREGGADYMTVVLPGRSGTREVMAGPVTFILTPERLVTVRHHTPRPFETYPERAGRMSAGCATPERVFLGLTEDIVARLADILEGAGRALDAVSRELYREGQRAHDSALLHESLQRLGREGETIGRVRLALLTLERAVSFFGQTVAGAEGDLGPVVRGTMRDVNALEVHTDFLSQRLAMATDATLGMINLAQNATVRIVSVVAVIFLPPTLIASAYGMNFAAMPELDWRWGYPMALGMMLASAVLTWLFFKWRKWL